jgi:adenylylsulfate kinase-like enzyme
MVIWLIGLSGAGKTTVAREVFRQWKRHAPNVVLLDEDELREAVGDQGGEDPTSIAGRRRQADCVTALCRMLDRQGIHVVCTLLSLFPELRALNRKTFSGYLEVYVATSLSVCMERDRKDLYRPALLGQTQNVVGVDLPFDPPRDPDLILDNGAAGSNPAHLARRVTDIALQRLGHKPEDAAAAPCMPPA